MEAGEADVGLRIGSALWRFWQLRSHEQEGRERLQELLALGSGSPAARAKAQTQIANLALNQGDLETARRMLEESLAVHRRDRRRPHGRERARAPRHGQPSAPGTPIRPSPLTREALEAARRGASPYMESAALWQLGVCLAAHGELDDAERTIEEAVDLARKLGDARSVGDVAEVTRRHRADARRSRTAWRLFDESLTIHRSLDDAAGVSHSLVHLALLALEAGDAESGARPRSPRRSRSNARAATSLWLANALEMSARLAARTGQPALAIRLYARAALLREIVGSRLHYELGWPDPTAHLADLRSRVGEATFEEQWERGRAMTLLEAIDQASDQERERPPRDPHGD